MKVHLTAIGGTGMGSLAGLLRQRGDSVRGTDRNLYPPMSHVLNALEIPVTLGFAESNLDWHPDLLVLGNTCTSDHVEYLGAKIRGIPVVSLPECLGQQFLRDRENIVVTGTHGKTTTTSLVTHILITADKDPGYLIGGAPQNMEYGFSNGTGTHFVIEGDEYDSACFDKRPKFAHYRPHLCVLTGIEFDHADIYSDLSSIERTFRSLVEQIPEAGILVVSADSKSALRVAKHCKAPIMTYSVAPNGTASVSRRSSETAPDWYGTYSTVESPQSPSETPVSEATYPTITQRLEVQYRGKPYGVFDIPLTGEHNMANALASIAIAEWLQITPRTIGSALRQFKGVSRRQQVVDTVNEITIIDDFAHHPTAVKTTLAGLRNVHGQGKLIAVFEPRSSTSRRSVFQSHYVDALVEADVAFIAPVFDGQKIDPADRLNVGELVSNLRARGCSAHSATIDELVALIRKSAHPGDTIVLMSSGAFGGIHDKVCSALRDQES